MNATLTARQHPEPNTLKEEHMHRIAGYVAWACVESIVWLGRNVLPVAGVMAIIVCELAGIPWQDDGNGFPS